jgi:molybdenum cofactor synthesis domain-containing protein
MILRAGILTVSDRSAQGIRPDASGPRLAERLRQLGWEITHQSIVADELAQIQAALLDWADRENLDLILTTGGTGFSQRDITPEATLAILHRSAPGIAEAMRMAGLKITPHAMLSRAVAGIRGRTLVINLPGSPKGALENLEVILPVLPHAVQLLQQDPAAEEGHTYPNKQDSGD